MDDSNSKDSQDEVNSLLSDVLKFKEVRNRRPLSCLPCRQRKYVGIESEPKDKSENNLTLAKT